jgi:hypothetical protein
MITGMAWRRHDEQLPISGPDDLAVRQRQPDRRVGVIVEALLEDGDGRPALAQRGNAGRMIGMAVCDEDAHQRPRVERRRDGIEVRRDAGACIDQGRLCAIKEPGVVACARVRTRIIGGEEKRREAHGRSIRRSLSGGGKRLVPGPDIQEERI